MKDSCTAAFLSIVVTTFGDVFLNCPEAQERAEDCVWLCMATCSQTGQLTVARHEHYCTDTCQNVAKSFAKCTKQRIATCVSASHHLYSTISAILAWYHFCIKCTRCPSILLRTATASKTTATTTTTTTTTITITATITLTVVAIAAVVFWGPPFSCC